MCKIALKNCPIIPKGIQLYVMFSIECGIINLELLIITEH